MKNIVQSSWKASRVQHKPWTSIIWDTEHAFTNFAKMYKNKYMIKHVTCDTNILNYIARIVVNSLPAKHDV